MVELLFTPAAMVLNGRPELAPLNDLKDVSENPSPLAGSATIITRRSFKEARESVYAAAILKRSALGAIDLAVIRIAVVLSIIYILHIIAHIGHDRIFCRIAEDHGELRGYIQVGDRRLVCSVRSGRGDERY